jgi:hypothetical protein
MELHSPLIRNTLVYCDNVSVVYLVSNPVQHQRTKHVEIDLHFVCDKVAIGEVHVLYAPMTSQFVDIFTKGMPSSLFSEFCSSQHLLWLELVLLGVLKMLYYKYLDSETTSYVRLSLPH